MASWHHVIQKKHHQFWNVDGLLIKQEKGKLKRIEPLLSTFERSVEDLHQPTLYSIDCLVYHVISA